MSTTPSWRIGALAETVVAGSISLGEDAANFSCRQTSPDEQLTERDLRRLRMAAAMIARLIDWARDRELDDATAPT